MEETKELQRVLEQKMNQGRLGTRCGRLGRKTHELNRSGVDRFGGYVTEAVERNTSVIEDHVEEHPVQERELSEFGRRNSRVETGNKGSHGFFNP